MARGTYCGDAARRTVFHLGRNGADVRFEDGTLFHRLCLESGVARVRHDCGADRYVGRYHVLDQDRWTLGWRVTGPRKEQRIASLFTRMI